THSIDYAIHISRNCDYNTIVGNDILDNDRYGFFIGSGVGFDCSGNTISTNTISNNGNSGIIVGGPSSNNKVLNNIISNNSNFGISLSQPNAINVSGNQMQDNWIYIQYTTSLADILTCEISSNTVNGNPVYFYKSNTALGASDFINAGQIILADCSYSTISGFSFSKVPFILYYCDNNNIIGNSVNDSRFGLLLASSNYNNISGNNLTNNVFEGMFLSSSCNNNVSGNFLTDNQYGIELTSGSNNNNISENVAFDNTYGISLSQSSDNIISGNNVSESFDIGIWVEDTSNNNDLTGNNITRFASSFSDLREAIYIVDSSETNLTGNLMNGGLNFNQITISQLSSTNIDTTNLMDGKPIYYYKDSTSLILDVNLNAGQLILANCNDSIISSQIISDSYLGISLFYCNNNTISGNNVTDCYYSIKSDPSNNMNFSGNTILNDYYGIYLDSSSNNYVSGNFASNCTYGGVSIASGSSNNTIWGNNIKNSFISLQISSSTDNKLYGNNVSNSTRGVYLSYSDSNNISENNISNNINGIYLNHADSNNIMENDVLNNTYGFLLEDSDNNNITGNTITGNENGIGIDTISGTIIKNNNFNGCTIYEIEILSSSGSGNIIYVNNFYGSFTSYIDPAVTGIAWDNGVYGNYFEDYTTLYPSASAIGLVWDTPYQINTSTFYDNYPLVYPSPLLFVNFTANATWALSSELIAFTSILLEPGVPPLTYQWDFGDGSPSSALPNPVYQYASGGNYTVTLTVTDSNGNMSTEIKNDYITVVTDIHTESSFIVNTSAILIGDSVGFTFTGNLGNAPSTIEWDFGDSSPNDTTQDPKHTYNSLGVFVPILTVNDTYGEVSSSSSGIAIYVLSGAFDEDGDGLSNFDEIKTHGTNPLLKDSDGDGYDDFVEIKEGTDPNNENDYPQDSGGTFWDQLVKEGLLIPIVGGVVGLVFTIVGIMVKKRLDKKEKKRD
ncbi:MAG: NosD domain-containing protein, partial [Candidatus Hodarchaeota archaeon]